MKSVLPVSLFMLFLPGVWASAAPAENSNALVRVTGAVARPGEYPLAQAATVYAAVRTAGGSLPNADLSRVRVKRIRSAEVVVRVVDAVWMAPGLARNAAPQPDPRDVKLEAGDEVFVPAAAAGPRNVVTRYFRDVPFSEAVESLLKDSNYGYTIDPAIAQQNLKITASVRNSPVESALRSISQAAGAQFRIEDDNIVITQQPNLSYAQQGFLVGQQLVQQGAGAPGESAMGLRDAAGSAGAVQTKALELRNVDPGTVLPLLSNIQGVQSAKSWGRNQLLITGRQDAVAEAERAVARMDTSEAYPRPVRVVIELVVSKGEQRYKCRTEEVGADGSAIPIDLDVGLGESEGGSGGSVRISGTVTPVILKPQADGDDLSLSGACKVSGRLFGGQFDKSFSFAASLKSGPGSEPKTLASGSLSGPKETFEFKVTAEAVIEKGRVAAQPAEKPAPAGEGLDMLVKAGRELLGKGKLDQAAACFERVVSLDPNNADARNGLGKSLAMQGKLDEAIVHLDKALRLEPSRLDYQQDLDEAVRLRGVPLGPETGN